MENTNGQEMYHFGLHLAEILRTKGIKQKTLSELTGFSEPYISQILSEKRTPDLATLARLCTAINVKLSYFLVKAILNEELASKENEEFLEKYVKPTLKKLDGLIYSGDKSKMKKKKQIT